MALGRYGERRGVCRKTGFRVTSQVKGIKLSVMRAPVFQEWAPSSSTLCMRESEGSPWTPTTSQMLLSLCQEPPWLLASTSMLVSHFVIKGIIGVVCF